MAILLKQDEAAPDSYPSTSPAVTGNDVAWQRVESYIAHRDVDRGRAGRVASAIGAGCNFHSRGVVLRRE
jgi:hypothetical protein